MGLNIKIFFLFSFCLTSVFSYEYIPVCMWETSKNYSPLPALGRINEEFFRDILIDKQNKENIIVVYLEKNLSPEDFTTFDAAGNNIFSSLSYLHKNAQVNYYPFVETPLKAIKSLPGVKTVSVTDDGLLPTDTKLEPGSILIVDLNDAKDNEGRNQMLKRHDSIIDSINKNILSKHDKVISLYTAVHSSWLVPSEMENENKRQARHLLDVAEDTKAQVITKADDTLLYASGPLVLEVNSTYYLTNCISDVANISKVTCDRNGTEKVSLFFNYDTSFGYWFLKSITVQDPEVDMVFNTKEVFAPFGFSYHCDNNKYQFEHRPDIKDKSLIFVYKLFVPGFQVERFRNTSGTTNSNMFSEAYDCVGFTTAPIWSGLFVTFILALIMTFGLCMIMDIKTMDRFDDPKGKTISINVVE